MRSFQHARYDIVSWHELPQIAKDEFSTDEEEIQDLYEDGSFCINIDDEGDVHDLGQFIRSDSKRFHGIAGLSNISCYSITLDRNNEQAIISVQG